MSEQSRFTPTEHSSVLGSSSAERRLSCAGSFRLEAEAKANREKAAADGKPVVQAGHAAQRGTALHEAIAHYLAYHDGEDPSFLRGKVFAGQVFSPGWLPQFKRALAAFDSFCAQHGFTQIALEKRVKFPGIPGNFGTIDVFLLNPDTNTLGVVDWKFGERPVSAERNAQLAYAAIGARADDGELGEWLADTKGNDVVTAIIQPAAPSTPTQHAWSPDSLDRVVSQMKHNYANRATADPVRGDHCQWCTAKSICPAWAEVAQLPPAVTIDFRVADDPLALAEQLVQADLLAEWATRVRKRAFTTMKDGVMLPGWKMVAKRGRRVWTNERKAGEAMEKDLEGDAYTSKPISPAQAQKLLGRARYDEVLGDHVEVRTGGYTIAPEGDSRVGVIPNLEARRLMLKGAQ